MTVRILAGLGLALSLSATALACSAPGTAAVTKAPVIQLAQASPQTAPAASVQLTPAWSRATAPGAKVAGGFFTVANKGGAADRLLSGSAEISNTVEVHEMAIIDGVMRMRALDKGLPIPAGGSVELKPGSYHIMFIDLKRQLKEGESFKGELVFEKAGKVPVEYKVMAVGAKAANEHKH